MHELEQLDRELDVADAAGPELELVRRPRPAGMCSVTRSRIRCTLSTKFSRAALVQIFGWTARTYASPSSASPAIGRALSSAWNSQLFAQRS